MRFTKVAGTSVEEAFGEHRLINSMHLEKEVDVSLNSSAVLFHLHHELACCRGNCRYPFTTTPTSLHVRSHSV